MSYNKTKTDPELGLLVHEYLVKMGVETPVISNGIDRKEKIDKIENHFREPFTALKIAYSCLQLDLGSFSSTFLDASLKTDRRIDNHFRLAEQVSLRELFLHVLL